MSESQQGPEICDVISTKPKTVNTALGSRLKHKLKLYAERLRIFRDTLILVFMNENSCLCKCFTELYLFF